MRSASTTNEAVSTEVFWKYCANPPLFTSDSAAQTAENTFCGKDCRTKSVFPKLVRSDSDKGIKMQFWSFSLKPGVGSAVMF